MYYGIDNSIPNIKPLSPYSSFELYTSEGKASKVSNDCNTMKIHCKDFLESPLVAGEYYPKC